MTSILTNVSAMTALQSLQSTNKNLEATQSRISTGLRVSEAKDNAAYWSIATSMRSDNSSLSTVKDALGFGAALVDTAYTGTNAAIKVVNQIKDKLLSAKQPGMDKAKIQSEIKQLQDQLTSIASSASFSGENWLAVDTTTGSGYLSTREIVASFTRGANGNITVGTLTVNVDETRLIDANTDATAKAGLLDKQTTAGGAIFSVVSINIGALTDAAADVTALDAMIDHVSGAAEKLATSAANLGAAKTRIDLQNEFIGSLRDAIDRGVGTLVDADMNQESTRLQALQVQQQLGIQALSIANSAVQSVMRLFQ
jgi:flagellin